MPMILAENLKKYYNVGDHEVRALDDVSFTIEQGELTAIVGQSGSGKSTLMNIIGCLDRPDGGRYVLDAHDVSRMSEAELAGIRNRKIGFVFQNFNLLPRMSAVENVETPLLYAGETWPRAKAIASLERVGLGHRMWHQPNELSGGQRQRVAIARALVTRPAILLADEPTGALDSKTGDEIMALFAELNDEGVTVIIVTHEPDIADRCRRVIVLRDGKIIDDRAGKAPPRAAKPKPVPQEAKAAV